MHRAYTQFETCYQRTQLCWQVAKKDKYEYRMEKKETLYSLRLAARCNFKCKSGICGLITQVLTKQAGRQAARFTHFVNNFLTNF